MNRTDPQTEAINQEDLLVQVETLCQQAQLMKAWRLLRDIPNEQLNEKLRRWKWGIDPTGVKTVPRDEHDANTASANQPWIDEHGDEYRGQWVALYCGELLASADTDGALIDALKALGRRERALIIKL